MKASPNRQDQPTPAKLPAKAPMKSPQDEGVARLQQNIKAQTQTQQRGVQIQDHIDKAKPSRLAIWAKASKFRVTATVADGEGVLAKVNLGSKKRLEITDKDIDSFNALFQSLGEDELHDVLGEMNQAVQTLHHLSDHHQHDPLVSRRKVHQSGEQAGPDRAEATNKKESSARKQAAIAEGMGHIGLPSFFAWLSKTCVGLVPKLPGAAYLSSVLHLAVEGLHTVAAVLDLHIAYKLSKHKNTQASVLFHLARAGLGIAGVGTALAGMTTVAGIFTGALVGATVGKIGWDFFHGRKATRQYNQARDRLSEGLRLTLLAVRAKRTQLEEGPKAGANNHKK